MATAGKKQQKKGTKKKSEVPFHRQPEGMSVEKWQMELRKQFVAQNNFTIVKNTTEIVFADYSVTNPASQKTYKVALRVANGRGNYCECYDFKINRLGTCKHIEAVFQYIIKKRLKKHLKEPVERAYSTVYIDYSAGRTVRLRIGSDHKSDFEKVSKAYFDEKGAINDNGIEAFDTFLQKAKQISEDFRCYTDAFDYLLELRETRRRKRSLSVLNPEELKVFLSELVHVEMYNYQQEGVAFAFANGKIIIGDEMGLGKTVQAIAAAELLKREQGISKVLILAPTSLKYQWKTEIEKFTGHQALVIEGVATVRARLHHSDTTFYKIASYHSALFDWKAMSEADYDLIILDEAQRIKNWRTKIAQSVRRIQARYAFVLTGTPIENNLEELYGLVQFVDPFALGPRHEFFSRYQMVNENNRVVGYENLGEIKKLLSDRLIRRLKKNVLKQLPARSDKNLVVPMTPEQSNMHREFADQVAKLVVKWQKIGFLDEQDRNRLLKNLNMMRMVCDSTYIIDPATNFQTKIDELRNILEEVLEIEGEKVVIFSQWARMNNLVAQMLTEMEVEFRYLHGDVPSKDRGALYNDFNNKPEVRIFLSTDAGGVGLNLQSAAWLVNLDIPWNPGTLEQRIGRIYRLGQEKHVNIINLVAQGTIEHNLLGVLQFKKSMAAGVLDDGEETIFMGDSKFKKFMESVEIITRDVAPIEITDAETTGEPDTDLEDFVPLESNPEPSEFEPINDELDAIPEQAVQSPTSKSATKESESPQALVQNGIQFFNQLAQTLANREATEQLVKTIVEKDEKTGQTYLKLPVESESTVHSVLNLLGGLLKGLSNGH